MINEICRGLADEPYEARGIIHSEMAVVISNLLNLGITRVIESGRARAQSTYIMAKYLPEVAIHSIELRGGMDEEFGRHRINGFMNVSLHYGDGARLAPWLAAQSAEPTAILFDGPKGIAISGPAGSGAVDALESCFAYPHVLVGFIHDMRKLDHGGPSPHRAAAIARLPHHVFSDDPDLIESFSHLDGNVRQAGGPVNMEAEYGSYGPTLGVFYNPQNKQPEGKMP